MLILSLEKVKNLSIRAFPKLFENTEGKWIFVGLKYKGKIHPQNENEWDKHNIEESKVNTIYDENNNLKVDWNCKENSKVQSEE